MAKLSEGASQTAEGSASGGTPRAPTDAPCSELERQLLAVFNHTPSMIFLKDSAYRYLFVNEPMARSLGRTPQQFVGLTDRDLGSPVAADQIHMREVEVMASGQPAEYEEELDTHLGKRYYLARKFVARDARGEPIGIGGIVTDITARKLEEAARFAEQQRTIAAQRDTLRELSTPLLPIADGVVAMTLVGAIDPGRAADLLDTLLRGITAQRARIAIIDVTGIREVDAEVARSLVAAARATRLVGAEVVLTGVSPTIARTLVELGVELGGITTLGTLASGIAFALQRR